MSSDVVTVSSQGAWLAGRMANGDLPRCVLEAASRHWLASSLLALKMRGAGRGLYQVCQKAASSDWAPCCMIALVESGVELHSQILEQEQAELRAVGELGATMPSRSCLSHLCH